MQWLGLMHRNPDSRHSPYCRRLCTSRKTRKPTDFTELLLLCALINTYKTSYFPSHIARFSSYLLGVCVQSAYTVQIHHKLSWYKNFQVHVFCAIFLAISTSGMAVGNTSSCKSNSKERMDMDGGHTQAEVLFAPKSIKPTSLIEAITSKCMHQKKLRNRLSSCEAMHCSASSWLTCIAFTRSLIMNQIHHLSTLKTMHLIKYSFYALP